jgi:hypothetical protein
MDKVRKENIEIYLAQASKHPHEGTNDACFYQPSFVLYK